MTLRDLIRVHPNTGEIVAEATERFIMARFILDCPDLVGRYVGRDATICFVLGQDPLRLDITDVMSGRRSTIPLTLDTRWTAIRNALVHVALLGK